MANVDQAFGLRPVHHLNGAPWNGQTKRMLIEDTYDTALFVGDPVIVTGTTPADDDSGIYPSIQIATAGSGNPIYGVIVSFDIIGGTNLREETPYNPAYTSRYANVVVDPDVTFIVQDDAGATLTGADIGGNCNLASGSGSTITGWSAWELDASAIGTTAADQLVILSVWPEEGNDLGDNCVWEVLISCHALRCQTGIKGV